MTSSECSRFIDMAALDSDTESPERTRAARRPVVFVHGFGANSGVWGTMRSWFKDDGYEKTYSLDYPTGVGPFVLTLEEIAAGFARACRGSFGSQSFDVVAHSMGSLITRQAIKYDFRSSSDYEPALGSQVARWVSLAGPNHGASNAWLNAVCGTLTCGPQLAGMKKNSTFLGKLNSGTEAPGPTEYLTYRTPGDEQVDEDSVPVTGNSENRRVDLRYARGGDDPVHNAFLTSRQVADGILTFLKVGLAAEQIETYRLYNLIAEHSGKAMDVRDAVGERGTPVQQYQANGTKAQVWEFIPGYAPGVFQIRSGVNFCLKEQESKAVLGDCGGGHTYWQAVPAEDGTFFLKNDYSGWNLDVPGSSHQNSVQLITYPPQGSSNQKWRLIRV